MNKNKIGINQITGFLSHIKQWFTKSYEFEGTVQVELLEQAFIDIFQATEIFKYKISGNDGQLDKYKWIGKTLEEISLMSQDKIFQHKSIVDLEKTIQDLTDNAYLELNQDIPMRYILLTGYKNNHFTICQTTFHQYFDSQSSNSFFNLVIRQYNKLFEKQQNQDLINEAKKKQSPNTAELTKDIYPVGFCKNISNFCSIVTTSNKQDPGKYCCTIEQINAIVKKLNEKRRVEPLTGGPQVLKRFDISKLIKEAKQIDSSISKNSIVCAFILLSIHNYNQKYRPQELGVQNISEIITMDLVFSVLDIKDQDKYYGNLMSAIKIAYNCKGKSVTELAIQFNKQVVENKKNKMHITLQKLIQSFFTNIDLMKKQKSSENSLMISNWTNYQFVQGKNNYMKECLPIKSFAGVCFQIKDDCPSAYSGKPPSFFIQMDPNDMLVVCISSFDENIVRVLDIALEKYYNYLQQ